jgi:hypothetical protein
MDWQRVHAILDIVQDDDVIDSLQSLEECDVVQVSDHDSDSEAELQGEIDDTYVDYKNGYICKNNRILSRTPKLSTTMNNAKIKMASKLRKRKLDEPKNCSRPKHAWQLLFTDDLIELIVASTNSNILKMGNSIASSTNMGEIKTLIGILYFHGVMRPTHQNTNDLWNKDFGVPCIKSAMKYDRFKFLLQNLCFDNDDDENIIKFDVMNRMRKVFEIFAMNTRASFEISNTAVIDEIIVPVYGPCPFRYKIKSKPLECGLKMVLMVDSSNFYVSNLDVITDPYFGAQDIVKKLVQHVSGTGRTIVIDSWYTSVELIDTLKREYSLYTIAAVHPKDEIIPPLFLTEYRKMRTVLTGFLDDNIQLTSYVNSDSKSVNVLVNEPHYYKKVYSNHATAVAAYKKNQPAVEVIDVIMHYYTTMQHTNDWTMSLFFTLLNIAAVNAQVIWSSQNIGRIVKRRSFITELATSLLECEDLLSPIDDLPLRKHKFSSLQMGKPPYMNRRRCRICVKTTKRDRRTKHSCIKCGQFICMEHAVYVCTMCVT